MAPNRGQNDPYAGEHRQGRVRPRGEAERSADVTDDIADHVADQDVAARRRVLIVDDHRSFAEALAIAVDAADGLECVAIAGDCAEGLAAAAATLPDVALVDLHLPDGPGTQLIAGLRGLRPDLPILALTAYADAASVAGAAQAGVCAFLRKESSIEHIVGALRAADASQLAIDASTLSAMMRQQAVPAPAPTPAYPEVALTPREHEVLELLADAYDARGIAKQLGISIHTSRGYVKALLGKLDAHTQLEAVVRASRLGLIGPQRHAPLAPPPPAPSPNPSRMLGARRASLTLA